ncbi:MAG: hypothetical protein VB878_04555 [Pirellulaceae bacterium]
MITSAATKANVHGDRVVVTYTVVGLIDDDLSDAGDDRLGSTDIYESQAPFEQAAIT